MMNDCTVPPPTSTPAPTTPGKFTQKQCSDLACSKGCNSFSFTQNVCVPITGGGSAMALCVPGEVTLRIYPSSDDCTGTMFPDTMPLNKCMATGSGGSLENYCGKENELPVEWTSGSDE
jgi:hypothetical protein